MDAQGRRPEHGREAKAIVLSNSRRGKSHLAEAGCAHSSMQTEDDNNPPTYGDMVDGQLWDDMSHQERCSALLDADVVEGVAEMCPHCKYALVPHLDIMPEHIAVHCLLCMQR